MKLRKPSEAASTGLIIVGATFLGSSLIVYVLEHGRPTDSVKQFAVIGAVEVLIGSVVLGIRKMRSETITNGSKSK